MKTRTIAIAVVGATLSFGVGAQVDPGFHDWVLTSFKDGSDTNPVHVYAESLIKNVTVEHWVVANPDEQGIRLGDTHISWSGDRYESSQDFLNAMWNRSAEAGQQWFYARQTVVYQPLSEVSVDPLYGETNIIACTRLMNEAGERVGVQVRTAAWSMYTDHWVLYPNYSPPSPDHAVSFASDPNEGCDNPATLLIRELDDAEASGQPEQYLYATTTFALVPLTPGIASPTPLEDTAPMLKLDRRARRPNLFRRSGTPFR